MSPSRVCSTSRSLLRASTSLACLLWSSVSPAVEAHDPVYRHFVFAADAEPKFRYEVRALDAKGELLSSFPVYVPEGAVLSGDTLRVDGAAALQTAVWMSDELLTVSEPQRFEPDGKAELELPEGLGYMTLIPVTVSVTSEQVNEELRRYDFNVSELYGDALSIEPELVSWPLGPDVGPVISKPPLKCPNTACVFVPERPKERLIVGLTACLGPLCAVTKDPPPPPPKPEGWKSVAVGARFGCGLTDRGRVLCWGVGISDSLGLPPSTHCVLPPAAPPSGRCEWVPRQIVQPPGSLTTFQALDAGREHACAIDTTGNLWCWGQLTFDRGSLCPGGARSCRQAPVKLTPNDPAVANTPARFRSVSAGGQHTCAVTTGDSIVCFGGNAFGAAGDHVSGTFASVGSLGRYSTVSSGALHTCALTLAGRVECWGQTRTLTQLPDWVPQAERFLAHPEDVMARHPSIVAGLADRVSAGKARTCIHDVNGTLSCFDEFRGGPSVVEQTDPVTTDLETALSDETSKCQIASGELYCDSGGRIPFSSPAVDSSVESSHSCAVESAGVAWCWGTGRDGQLGDGSGTDADPSRPVAVMAP